MRVRALYNNCRNIEIDIKKMGFFLESEIYLSINHEYEVNALSVFDGIIFLQIVNDINYPAWLPAIFFEIINNEIPKDWICNIFKNEPSLLVGPNFIAKDIKSYNSMVELEPNQVESFWLRIEKK